MIAENDGYHSLADRIRGYAMSEKTPDWHKEALSLLEKNARALHAVVDYAICIATQVADVGERQRAHFLPASRKGMHLAARCLDSIAGTALASGVVSRNRYAIAYRALDQAFDKHHGMYGETCALLRGALHDEETLLDERETIDGFIGDCAKDWKDRCADVETYHAQADDPRLERCLREKEHEVELIGADIRAGDLALTHCESVYESVRTVVQLYRQFELELKENMRTLELFRDRYIKNDPSGHIEKCVRMLHKYQCLIDKIKTTRSQYDARLSAVTNLSIVPLSESIKQSSRTAKEQGDRNDETMSKTRESVEEILQRRKKH